MRAATKTHARQQRRVPFQQRLPLSKPLILSHACNVASAWQTSGFVNMIDLRRELLRRHFFFDIWPLPDNKSPTNQASHDVIVARFNHQLHEKYGEPPSQSSSLRARAKQLAQSHTSQSNTSSKRTRLTSDEQWNQKFWSPSSSSSNRLALMSDSILNYPMPGENHHNDADSPLETPNSTNLASKPSLFGLIRTRKRKIRKKSKQNFSPDSHLAQSAILPLEERGYVFIFSSGAVVTWGYNGRDRDWIDSFLQLYQDRKTGWPSFDGFKLPLWVTVPLWMSDRSWLWPSDMTIVRSDFEVVNWMINKQQDVNQSLRGLPIKSTLSNNIEQWDTSDVQQWLVAVGLDSVYSALFEEHGVDGAMLLRMTRANASEEEQTFVRQVLLGKGTLSDYFLFLDEMEKLGFHKEDIFDDNDELWLPANVKLDMLLGISFALAQCARLNVLFIAVGYYQRNLMVITEKLARKGRLRWVTKGHWSKLVHHCEMLRDMLFDDGAEPILTKTPTFVQQRGNEVEELYDVVLEYMEFDKDRELLHGRVEQLKDRYESDWEATRDNYGFRLEMIIILFFAIETWEFWTDGFKWLKSAAGEMKAGMDHKRAVEIESGAGEEEELVKQLSE